MSAIDKIVEGIKNMGAKTPADENAKKIPDRLKALREQMKAEGMDYYLITTSDYHASEYVSDYFKAREYFSNFTGSNGNLLVGAEGTAGLWTDGRYFVQAEKELKGTGIKLFKMREEGVPTISEYLKENMKQGQCLGFDGLCVSAEYGEALEKALKGKEIRIAHEVDLAGRIWNERPALPSHPLWVLEEKKCGRTAQEKLKLVREKMQEKGASWLVLSKLDDLMWLLNIRGGDVECNPVALSYGLIGLNTMIFFVQTEEVTKQAEQHFRENHIEVKPYGEFVKTLKEIDLQGNKMMADPANLSYSVVKMMENKAEVVRDDNPTILPKAVKTKTELEQIRDVYLDDSVAVTRFIYWVKTHIGKEEIDEYSAAMKMDSFRREIGDFVDLSFPTISAYGANAAMMHYEATPEDKAVCAPEGFLLVDSGGQYNRGTTDVTRTIALGPIPEEYKLHYSKTAAGMLNLYHAKFLYGCGGTNLDVLAREPLWELGIDYKCGTGHGIGYILNVHEGPQSIRMKPLGSHDVPLEEGMIVSDEPGVYVAGSHGIRIENIIEVQKDVHTSDGQFMKFSMLTYAPLEREALDPKYLTERELERVNEYQQAVYDKVSPKLQTQEERDWLYEVTRPLE